LLLAPVWYARAGVTDCDAEKQRSPVLAQGGGVRSRALRTRRSSLMILLVTRPTDMPFDLVHWAVQVAVVAAMEAGQKRK